MNKQSYLAEMAKLLRPLSKVERDEVLLDYSEHFDYAIDAGRPMSEIISKLGAPSSIANEILAQYEIRKASDTQSFRNLLRAVRVTIRVSILNLVFVLVPFIVTLVLLGGYYFLTAALLSSPILFLIQHNFSASFFQDIFYILGLFGLGLLCGIGVVRVTRWYYKTVLRYLNYNLSIIRGRT
ncbi:MULTISPECIES: HAAS signaling domain-containing protein [Paenibacillus]|uniref:DUF1700 domain-containing protein n=1 Tax=Paenibacillus alvei TaxID=44250 RepID=A0ABT4E8T8_PAEAL|nr:MULTISPECIES: DUF1700 domain-containing protein [Paenibacillus]EPY13702.1 hypothetical protein PAAL66ix_06733 [Paenibacillus alvei A6-6i-x]MCY9530156.1 DUF1700 domain-containing protein [Paenibacillus alvei]SDF64036.1 Uncharacterized membrane protein [Paenibacillus sp. cl6col]